MNAQKKTQSIKQLIQVQNNIQNLGFNIVDTDPWVPMKLGGNEFKFELSYQAALEVFQHTGLTIGVDAIGPRQILNPEVFPVLLLAGLHTHHGEFGAINDENKSTILRLIPLRHLNYYVTVIEAALRATEPDPEQVAELTGNMRQLMAELRDTEDPASPLEVVDISGGSTRSVQDSDSPEMTFSE